ncbi:MAG: DNA processing protein [Gammaproteobacteria bacterium]|jgi:DNA processing protein
MELNSLTSLLKLFHTSGIGTATILELKKQFDNDFQKVLASTGQDLKHLGYSQRIINCILSARDNSVETDLEWLSIENNSILTFDDPDYPDLLREISDPPALLYCSGNRELLATPQIAIVGSRSCTPGGAQAAYKFAAALAQAGITVTSGMALGIDTEAHKGALSTTGRTIAVTGTGLDRIYPSSNKNLAYEIHQHGLLISEFALGSGPTGFHFPRRNRIISGLSVGTLVVEATIRSGSLITAQQALEQGREVFAIPGSINNPQARGCHHLIRQGAKLVDQVTDIIEEISSLFGYLNIKSQVETPETETTMLDQSEQKLLEVIGYEPVNIDQLVERSGLTIEQLSSMLLILELNDHIQSLPGGFVARI